MKLARTAAAVAVGTSLVLAGPAGAALKKPKPVCNLLVDPAGDDGGANPALGHTDSLDILGGDIASDGKTVTVVLRLAKAVSSDSATPTGRSYYLDFAVPGGKNKLSLGVTTTPTTTSFSPAYVDGSLHRGLAGNGTKGTFDEAKKELRISTSASDWAAYGDIKKGTVFSELQALSFYFVGAYAPATPATGVAGGGSLQAGDTADATKSYKAGDASCVKVGS
jgi:hypothetical protein